MMQSFSVIKKCWWVVLLIILTVLAVYGLKPIAVHNHRITPAVVKRHLQPPKVVVALGSGGARGYAHLGVLSALHDAGIPIDGITCASAGCVVGALYADKGDIHAATKAMMSAGFWDFADMDHWYDIRGMVSGLHLIHFLHQHMHAKLFCQLKIPLNVALTDVQTGALVVARRGDVAHASMASSALPGLVAPVHFGNHYVIDGGVVDPVPVDIAKMWHPKLIIAVDVERALNPKLPNNAKGFYDRAYQMLWVKVTKQSIQGADIIIHPDVKQTGVFDMSHKQALFQAGYRAARQAIPLIKSRLALNRSPKKKVSG